MTKKKPTKPITVQLKQIKHGKKSLEKFEKQGISIPDLNLLIGKILKAKKPIKDILYNRTSWHLFANKPRFLPQYNCLIMQVCSYVPNEDYVLVDMDFEASEIEALPEPIFDPVTKKQKELVYVREVLIAPGCILIESGKQGAGVQYIGNYLNWLIKKFAPGEYPTLSTSDVISRDLIEAIKKGGGAESVTVAMSEPPVEPGSKYGQLLTPVLKRFKNNKKMVVKFESDTTFNDKEVVDIYEESQTEDGINHIVIHLAAGGTITDVNKYRVRRIIEVETDSNRRKTANRVDLRKKMIELFLDLQNPNNGGRLVDDKGFLV